MQNPWQGLEDFEWDRGNLLKNPAKHRVSNEEAEEVFFRHPVVVENTRSADNERRWCAFAKTERGRVLRVVFTMRGLRVRIISARPASRKERIYYERLR
jgi:uncharacterized DUF497 family protein